MVTGAGWINLCHDILLRADGVWVLGFWVEPGQARHPPSALADKLRDALHTRTPTPTHTHADTQELLPKAAGYQRKVRPHSAHARDRKM